MSALSRIGMMVAVGHTEMMLIGNGVTTDREDHVKIRFQHKGVLVSPRHCSMCMAISLQQITMSCKTTREMDVTMRTMQSTSVMVNRKLTYKPKDKIIRFKWDEYQSIHVV